jgi:D-lactate dehydratase / protein deglycase
MTHRDRKLLTGDSPFAANALGKLAAESLLEEAAGG